MKIILSNKNTNMTDKDNLIFIQIKLFTFLIGSHTIYFSPSLHIVKPFQRMKNEVYLFHHFYYFLYPLSIKKLSTPKKWKINVKLFYINIVLTLIMYIFASHLFLYNLF